MAPEKIEKVYRIYNGIRLGVLFAIIIIAIALAVKNGDRPPANDDLRLIQKTDTIILDH